MTKTVLITGAGGGIGRATIHHFAQNGWGVIGVDRNEFGEGFPQGGCFIQADISNPESTEQIFEQARAFNPTLHALVNNAAVQVAKPLVETTVEEWDAVMASNLRSVFLFVKLAHPLMKAAGGGAIVNVSSVHAIQTSANIAAYAASKGGLLALTRAMAIEFAPDEIRVNAILPGAVDTPMLWNNPNVKSGLETICKSDVGRPEDVAEAILFACVQPRHSRIIQVIDGGQRFNPPGRDVQFLEG